MLSMKEAIENYVEGCVGKVDCPAYKLFMKAILAGMMIAFGAAGSSVAAHDIANVGIAPVSYTHLDVYKRQALILQRQLGIHMYVLTRTLE